MTEQAVPMFMQYGAMGILALGFIILLLLYVKADKRAEKYAASLETADDDRTTLIDVVRQNTAANTQLSGQLANMSGNQQRTAEILDRLYQRLENGQCPYANERIRG